MSIEKEDHSSIAARIKVERNKLGFTQEFFAKLGGVTKRSQLNYEYGSRTPDANYLANLAKIGRIDVLYILTGVRVTSLPTTLDRKIMKSVIIQVEEGTKLSGLPISPEIKADMIFNLYDMTISDPTLRKAITDKKQD